MKRTCDRTLARIFLLGLAFPVGDVCAQDFIPGRSYYGRNRYVEYIAGSSPIIISVPHDGRLLPTELPFRTRGTLGGDLYTQDLAQRISNALLRRTGQLPHLILCHLDRLKIDQNREIHEATGDDSLAIISYDDYHNFIDTAAAVAARMYGKGLLIDLHRSGHLIQRLELAYSILRRSSDFRIHSSTLCLWFLRAASGRSQPTERDRLPN